jgi:outer membrane receptor protein involved in Fe transport
MRKYWLLCCVLALSLTGYAQIPPMGGGAGGARRGGPVPSIGHFYGKVVDTKTNKGMDGASIQLIQTKYNPATHGQKDTVIAGQITDRHGEFSLENLPILGNFRLKITAIGYKTYEQKVAFDLKGLRGAGGAAPGGAAPVAGDDAQQQQADRALQALNAVDKDLGNIKMDEDAETMQSAVVTASKPLLTMGVDRKVYNVEKDISAPGGTGVDVMRNVPSLQVDIDGNVTLRNSTPIIFVDGRPTTLTLDQIPGDAIESVEIITNPGAKYDASGGQSGILNIVLKKNRKSGYNGSVRAGIDDRGKPNLGGDFNVKQGKINIFLAGSFNERKSISPGTINRYTFNQPGTPAPPNDSLTEYDNAVNQGYFAFARGGFDYLIDNRNTLSLAGNLVHGTFTPYTNSNIYIDTVYSAAPTTSSYTREVATSNSLFNNHGGMLSFKHTFPKSGEEITADVNYSQGTNNNDNLITSYIYDVKGGPLSSVYPQQQTVNGTNKYFTAQADYTLPFTEKSKFEAGARVAIRNIYSLTDLDTINNGKYILESLLSSAFNYRDQVTAAYATYSNIYGGFTYQLGFRVEAYKYTGLENYTTVDPNSAQVDTVGHYGNHLPLDLFPSLNLVQKVTDNQSISFSYTRRIDRPTFNQLFPFTDYSDSLNLSKGNPALNPQITNSFELAYDINYGTTNAFIASVYYKRTTDLITRNADLTTNPVNGETVIVNSYINATSGFVGGLELIDRQTINKWWDLTTNVNVYTSKINTVDTGFDAVAPVGQIYSVFAKMLNSFKLSNHFTFQLSGDFTSKTELPPGGSSSTSSQGNMGGRGGSVSGNADGYNRPTGGMDASLRFQFLKNNAASLTLTGSDLLRTRVSDVYTYASTFTQEANRRRDPQFFRLQFNWRFGKFDMSLLKRKNNKADQDQMQNIQGGAPGGGGPGGGGPAGGGAGGGAN